MMTQRGIIELSEALSKAKSEDVPAVDAQTVIVTVRHNARNHPAATRLEQKLTELGFRNVGSSMAEHRGSHDDFWVLWP